jgi:predicted RNase H-like nuclease (RuvC/YqgF family)
MKEDRQMNGEIDRLRDQIRECESRVEGLRKELAALKAVSVNSAGNLANTGRVWFSKRGGK